MNWRRSDIISFGTLLTLLVWIFYAGAKMNATENISNIVSDKETGVESHEVRIRLLERSNQDEMVLLNDIAEAVGVVRRTQRVRRGGVQ